MQRSIEETSRELVDLSTSKIKELSLNLSAFLLCKRIENISGYYNIYGLTSEVATKEMTINDYHLFAQFEGKEGEHPIKIFITNIEENKSLLILEQKIPIQRSMGFRLDVLLSDVKLIGPGQYRFDVIISKQDKDFSLGNIVFGVAKE